MGVDDRMEMDDRGLLLYMGTPFCPQQCAFCKKKALEARVDSRSRYISALCREVQAGAPDFSDRTVPAVWIGGGVPGHMFDEDLGVLLRSLPSLYNMEDDPEITLKVHPGMVSVETVNACRRGRVTRLSVEYLTASSFEHEGLSGFLDTKAMDVTKMVLSNSAMDLSFDLIVGAPGQSAKSLQQTIDVITGYGASHVSLYPLELIPGSALFVDRQTNAEKYQKSLRKHLPTATEKRELIAVAHECLISQGFSRYLPWRYALPDAVCRYLLLESQGMDTLGFGLGAQTIFDGIYSENTSDLNTYLRYSDDPRRCIVEVRPLAMAR